LPSSAPSVARPSPDAAQTVTPSVCAYDFVERRTDDGRKFRFLIIIDEANRECLALIVARELQHEDVLVTLADLFVARVPSDEAYCGATRIECRPFSGNAVSPITRNAASPPARRSTSASRAASNGAPSQMPGSDEMIELAVADPAGTSCHRLHALAVSRTDQTSCLQRVPPPLRWMR